MRKYSQLTPSPTRQRHILRTKCRSRLVPYSRLSLSWHGVKTVLQRSPTSLQIPHAHQRSAQVHRLSSTSRFRPMTMALTQTAVQQRRWQHLRVAASTSHADKSLTALRFLRHRPFLICNLFRSRRLTRTLPARVPRPSFWSSQLAWCLPGYVVPAACGAVVSCARGGARNRNQRSGGWTWTKGGSSQSTRWRRTILCACLTL